MRECRSVSGAQLKAVREKKELGRVCKGNFGKENDDCCPEEEVAVKHVCSWNAKINFKSLYCTFYPCFLPYLLSSGCCMPGHTNQTGKHPVRNDEAVCLSTLVQSSDLL